MSQGTWFIYGSRLMRFQAKVCEGVVLYVEQALAKKTY